MVEHRLQLCWAITYGETKKFLPRFKYDKSKVEDYQLALIVSLGNLWVVDSIGHLGANDLTNMLQQCVGVVVESTFGNKPSRRSYRKRHWHKPWFDVVCRTTKHELRLWLKANLDSHAVKHWESKILNLLKRKRNKVFLGNYKNSTYVCAC